MVETPLFIRMKTEDIKTYTTTLLGTLLKVKFPIILGRLFPEK